LRSTGAQAKLIVGQSNDTYEQEADRMADRVTAMPDAQVQRVAEKDEEEQVQAKPLADQITPLVQRQTEAPEEEPVQTKAATGLPKQISPHIESGMTSLKGGGQPLDPSTRSFFEPRFGRSFENVRVHTGSRAEETARSVNARAYTLGNNVVFASGEYQPNAQSGKRLLGHELTHVIQQGKSSPVASQPRVQCDLVRQPPGRSAEARQLAPDEVDAAVAYNNRRFGQDVTRQVLDIVGASPTGRFDANSIHTVVEWQADFRLGQDGKIGLRTVREIVREMIAEGMRNTAIWTVIDAHDMRTDDLVSIRYDRNLRRGNAETYGNIPGPSRVRVGPTGFSQGYEGFVHTIAHELEHVRQRAAGIMSRNVREFLGESIELRNESMLPENVAGFMSDARRALSFWRRMTAAEQRANRQTFIDVRADVRTRFDAATAADQATHQATRDAFNGIVVPAP